VVNAAMTGPDMDMPAPGELADEKDELGWNDGHGAHRMADYATGDATVRTDTAERYLARDGEL
jgi:hypothetical protein